MLVDAVGGLWYHINAGSYVAVLDADTMLVYSYPREAYRQINSATVSS